MVVLAIVPDGAAVAERAGLADAAAVQDQCVRRPGPVGRGQCGVQLLFDNLGVLASRNADPVCDAQHVSIDGQTGNAKRVSQDHVRCLAADAWKRDELVHRSRNLACVLRYDSVGHADERPRLGSEEAGGLNLRLEFVCRRTRKRRSTWIPPEERRRDLIYALIGALG